MLKLKEERASLLAKCTGSYKCRSKPGKEEEEEGNSMLGNRRSYSGCPLHLQELMAFSKKP